MTSREKVLAKVYVFVMTLLYTHVKIILMLTIFYFLLFLFWLTCMESRQNSIAASWAFQAELGLFLSSAGKDSRWLLSCGSIVLYTWEWKTSSCPTMFFISTNYLIHPLASSKSRSLYSWKLQWTEIESSTEYMLISVLHQLIYIYIVLTGVKTQVPGYNRTLLF